MTLRVAYARLRKIRTFSAVMAALGAFGLCVTTVPIYLNLVLHDHFGHGSGTRGVIGAVGSIGALAGAALGGVYSDRLFRRSPAACLYLVCGALAATGIGFGVLVYSPNVATLLVVSALTQGVLFAGLVPLSLVVASVTPPELRATAFAFVGLYLAVVGGLGGAIVTSVAEALWGAQVAVAVVAPAASVIAGLVLARSAAHLPHDIERVAA
jgi:MFS family permease